MSAFALSDSGSSLYSKATQANKHSQHVHHSPQRAPLAAGKKSFTHDKAKAQPKPITSGKGAIKQVSAQASAISEVVLSEGIAQTGITFAMLAHLSHQYKSAKHSGRWLTWICPLNISRAALAEYDFDVLGMRILQPKPTSDIAELMHSALKAGTSHTVVCHCSGISHKHKPWLEQAARAGECSGMIIRPE